MLPKLLWTYWDGPHLRPFEAMCIDSWRRRLEGGGWRITITTPTTLKRYVHPEDLPTHFGRLSPQRQADAARVALLARYGGVWMDAGTYMLKGFEWLEEIMGGGCTFAGYNFGKHGPEVVENWFLACTPGDPFVSRLHRVWVDWTNRASAKSKQVDQEVIWRLKEVKQTKTPSFKMKSLLYMHTATAYIRQSNPEIGARFEDGRAVLLESDWTVLWITRTWRKRYGEGGTIPPRSDMPDVPFLKFSAWSQKLKWMLLDTPLYFADPGCGQSTTKLKMQRLFHPLPTQPVAKMSTSVPK